MKVYTLENPYLSEIYMFDTYEAASAKNYKIYEETNLKCKIKEILIPSIELYKEENNEN